MLYTNRNVTSVMGIYQRLIYATMTTQALPVIHGSIHCTQCVMNNVLRIRRQLINVQLVLLTQNPENEVSFLVKQI